ncbi:MAG: hypothetical protein J2P23_14835 [Microlunatus sp.]|nr:hypothetical protein [Microlunatus sp.]
MLDTSPKTFTVDTLRPAGRRSFYFIGVTTGSSSIRSVFPLWAEHLGLGDVELVGIDLAVHAPAGHYRKVVEFLRSDPLSIGALVTTHKLDLYAAASDLVDEIDPLARLMGEVSSLSKRNGRLRAHAKDPISCGLAIEAFLPAGHFSRQSTDLVIFGAGGSAVAIDWYLSDPGRANRPDRVVTTDSDRTRLDALVSIHRQSGRSPAVETVPVDRPDTNDRVLDSAREGALVINATGLGKDAPGSPLSGRAQFPDRAIVWDLNYRGDLAFLEHARRQAGQHDLQIEDGWVYFIHGWTQVIAEVFDIAIPTHGHGFAELARLAREARR